jgi:hypothetical protein
MTKDDRLFAPFPIEMDEHPKIIGLSDAAFRAIFEATFYSRRMLSDGFLDERVVLRRWGQQVADELSSNDPERPSWIRVDHGWRIHDFEKHHPLKAEIDAKRADVAEKRSVAGRKGNAVRWQTDRKSIANDRSETETETETLSSTKRDRRASRIPEPFIVNRPMREWAAEEVPGVNVDATTKQFVDYWRASSLKTATKRDWVAAWRYWLRKDAAGVMSGRPAKLTPEQRARQTLALAGNLKELE